MNLSARQKVVVARMLRSAAAVIISFAIAWLSGPDAADILDATQQQLVAGVLIPILLGVNKALRMGSDPDDPAAG